MCDYVSPLERDYINYIIIIFVTYLFQCTHIHFFYGCDDKRRIKVYFVWQNSCNKILSLRKCMFIPISIFASARFVMWKKPSFAIRNTWYVPAKVVKQTHTILAHHLENRFRKKKKKSKFLRFQLMLATSYILTNFSCSRVLPEESVSSSMMRYRYVFLLDCFSTKAYKQKQTPKILMYTSEKNAHKLI